VEVTETAIVAARQSLAHRGYRAGICDGVIMNRAAAADSWKREKAENLMLMLKGAIDAASKVGLAVECSPRRSSRCAGGASGI